MAATETIDLCTLQEVKVYVSLDTDKAVGNIDTLLERLITSKTKAITTYIGYTQILAAEYTEYIDGNGTQYLFPSNIPINTVTSVHDSPDWVYDSDSLIDSSYYKIVDKRYIVLNGYAFAISNQNVKIVYNAGYTTIPEDLAQVCIEEVVRTYNDKANIGVSSRTDRHGGVTKVEKGFMTQSIEIMDKYRKIGVY
jgi:hypothetical protein